MCVLNVTSSYIKAIRRPKRIQFKSRFIDIQNEQNSNQVSANYYNYNQGPLVCKLNIIRTKVFWYPKSITL